MLIQFRMGINKIAPTYLGSVLTQEEDS